MAKIVKSYSLSQEAIDEIKRLKEEKNYKSESDALESLILNKETNDDKIKRLIQEILKDYKVALVENESAKENAATVHKNDEVESMLLNSLNDMMNELGG